MDSNNKFEEIDIKNCKCCCFGILMNINDIDLANIS